MRAAYRLALCAAIGFAVFAAGLGAFYYLHARPMWSQAEKHQAVEKLLRDPATPSQTVRRMALEEHELLGDAFEVIDTALELLLLCGFAAALILGYVAYFIRKRAREAQGAS